MHKTCVMCGHMNLSAAGFDTDACPQCGAIYTKAKPAAVVVRPPAQPVALAAPLSVRQSAESLSRSFINQLRANSYYPIFRKVVTVLYVLGQVVAIGCVLAGVFGGYKTGSVETLIGGIIAAAFTAIFCQFAEEAALMIAELSDATVRMAAPAE